MLQSGAIDLLDIQLITQVSNFFAENKTLNQLAKFISKKSDEYLVPHYNEDISTFYNVDTKKLKPKYKWYRETMVKLRYVMKQVKNTAAEISKSLKQKMNTKQLQKIKADSTQ
jgi:6-pyruvoyl-tetrahydropterin synthase